MNNKTNKRAAVTLRLLIATVFIGSLMLGVRFLVRAQPTPGLSIDSDAEALLLRQTHEAATKASASIPTGPGAPALRRAVANELDNELENFVASHLNSPRTPGVRLELARNAQSRSGYLRALEHYGQAWESAKNLNDAANRGVAMKALGGAAKLLALTGRMSELDALEAEANTVFKGRPAGSDWNWAMEMRTWVRKHPSEAYKCGLYCLDQLGRLTQPGKYSPRAITETESSTNGFTAAELVQIGERAGLRIHVALLSDFENLPIPCIVHLESEHFVIVRERRGAFYDVYDTVAFGPRWLTAAEIAREATGCVIVSDQLVGAASLQTMNSIDANAYRGRCHGPLPNDHDDSPCYTCPCPPGSGNGGGIGAGNGGGSGGGIGGRVSHSSDLAASGLGSRTGGSDIIAAGGAGAPQGCGSCSGGRVNFSGGMPTWFVSEPYLNLWVQDTPLQYQPGYGPSIRLDLAYTGRRYNSLISGYGVYGAQIGDEFGQGFWSCSWFSYAELDGSENSVELRVPGGNWRSYSFPANSSTSDIQYVDNTWLEKVGTSGDFTSLILHHPNGSVDHYAVSDDGNDPYYRVYYVSDQSDPLGNKTSFNYDSSFYLTTVTAADGTSFTLHFDHPDYAEMVTSVTSSYGASVSFSYDNPYSFTLSGITDAAGITSQISYYLSYGGQISSIVTPYGTTTFDSLEGVGVFDRTVLITRGDNTQEFYAQLNNYTTYGSDWPDFAASQIPTNTPVGTLDTNGRQERNTFYWNAQQFAPYVGASLYGFTWADLNKARIRHWLATPTPTYTHFDTLSAEQSPSPDGTTEGQITWYDYAGKQPGANDERGTQTLPSLITRVMPDTSTWYQYFEYNSIGKATNTIEKWNEGSNPLSRTNVYVYAANGVDMTAWTNTLGVRVLNNVYNGNHQVTTSSDALNQATTYTYDPTTLLLTSVSVPAGLTSTNVYDSTHRLQKTIDLQINRTNYYTWYSGGDMQTHTDERGLTVTYFWDGLSRLTGTSYPDGTTTTILYTRGTDQILERTATKDRMGFWTYYDYDSLRRLIAVTNANNVVTRYGFCDCGAVAYVTNAWGTAEEQDISYDFDFQGNRLHTYLPDATMTYSYDSLGRATTTADGWGSRYFYYDNLSRLTNTSNAYGAEQGTVFDVDNRPVYVTDANGVTITNTYDALGRLRTRGYPDGGVEKFGYSPRGLVAYTNQLNFTNFYVYDEALRKTFETNANAEVIRYTNSAAGDLLSLTDGKNQTTRWKYDQYGRVTNKVDQASAEILRYKYDPDNRLTNRWSAAMGITTYKYDQVANLTNVVYPSGTTSVKLAYDSMNRMTNMVDGLGTTKYSYTVGGQLYTEDGPWSSDTVTNLYSNRLRVEMDLQQPTGCWTNAFGYDAAKRLTNVTSPAGAFGYVLGATAPTSAQIKKLLLPNTSYITNIYDGNARLLGTWLNNSSDVTLDAATYGYNAGNQRTAGGYTNASSCRVNFTYDRIGQLKVADSTVNAEDRGYVYDKAWNLSYLTNNGSLTSFTADNKNQLNSAPNTASPIYYDANGNLTSMSAYGNNNCDFRFYDAENRLTVAYYGCAPSSFVFRYQFSYDGLGRLRIQQYYDSNGLLVNEKHYIYDGMRVIQERDVNNNPTVSYTRGSDLSGTLEGAGGIGGMLARSHGYSSGSFTNHNYYHADGNGNITYMVNSSQTKAASYRYDAYGNTLTSSGTLASANVYRFSSKERVGVADYYGSEIYYYGYRFYEPALQRWLNRDPIEEDGGLNLYSFNLNNSVCRIDTDGRGSIATPAGAEALVIAVGESEAAETIGAAAARAAARRIAARAAAACLAAKCAKEWEEAREWCKNELAKPPYQQNSGTGGYTDIENCARGRVSMECGGNPVAPKPKPKRRPPIIFPFSILFQ